MNCERFDIAQYLSVLPLFGDLSNAQRQRLVAGCSLHPFGRGEPVFASGDECQAFYVVVTGKVRLYVATPNGQEKVIELIDPSHSFAEAFMFLDKPYMVNAQALEDSLLLRVAKQVVVGEIQRDPHLAMNMLAGISRRLHGLVRDVAGYTLQSGQQRLIGYLLRDIEPDCAVATGATLTVDLSASKATIASRLSLTPEYFSRVLHELQQAGLIEICKREIRILDTVQLAAYGSH
jgi:CRP-like cAMP-binding protein